MHDLPLFLLESFATRKVKVETLSFRKEITLFSLHFFVHEITKEETSVDVVTENGQLIRQMINELETVLKLLKV